jgi:small subunit ribosomal protein S16
MVRIRLRRTGKTKQPSYRVVVADQRSPRDGKFIEIIGHYNPVRQPKVLEINGERARYWLSVGAQPSDTVVKLFKRVNVLDEQGKVIAATPAEAEAPAA